MVCGRPGGQIGLGWAVQAERTWFGGSLPAPVARLSPVGEEVSSEPEENEQGGGESEEAEALAGLAEETRPVGLETGVPDIPEEAWLGVTVREGFLPRAGPDAPMEAYVVLSLDEEVPTAIIIIIFIILYYYIYIG